MNDSQSKPGLGDLDVFATATKHTVEKPRPRSEPIAVPKEATPVKSRKPIELGNKVAPRRRVKVATRSQVFYLPDDQIDKLKKLSQQTDRSKSDLAREAIGEYLDKVL